MRALFPFLVLLAVTAAACAGASDGPPERPPDPSGAGLEAFLTARNDSLLQAIGEADAGRAAEYFLADGILLPPNGSVVRGGDRIRRFWDSGTGFDSVATEPLAFVGGEEIASQAGSYVIWSTSDDGTPVQARGIFLMVWRRDADGVWRIHSDMWR